MPTTGALERLDFDVRDIRVTSAPCYVGVFTAFVAGDRFNELGAISEEWWRHWERSGCRIGGSAMGLSATDARRFVIVVLCR
jgi:hypothetical protein